MNLAKTARNAAVADLAIAFARDRLAAQLPGVKPRKRRPGKKTLLIGGIAATAAAALLLKRDKVAALLPGRSDEPAPPEPSYTPPPVSNYDAPGPVANTATPVPVPPAQESPTIDEAEEEAAAAAEAANIGGTVSDYAGPDGEYATDAESPLAEAGEGESEGEEQTDLELREAAEDDEDGLSPEQAQIEEAIDDAANPLAGEDADPGRPGGDPEWRTWSGRTEQ
jgi:hypothetical protein